MYLLRNLLFLTVVISTVSAKSFLQQLLSWDFGLGKHSEQRDTESPPITDCVCNGPGCICCTDFNLTYIDLGGPGCVSLKYISPDEGMAVNVSYGNSLLHSEVVKGTNPPPTCMNILSDLAQICARFTELSPTADGARGCLHMEPRLIGESQAEYDLGCFRAGPQGMTFDPPANNSRPASETTDTDEPPVDEGPTEEEVIAAVSETAEQGLAFLSSLLGLDVVAPESTNNAESTTVRGQQEQSGTNTESVDSGTPSSVTDNSNMQQQGGSRAFNNHLNEVI